MSAVTIGYLVPGTSLRRPSSRLRTATRSSSRARAPQWAATPERLRITRRGRLVLTGAVTAVLAVSGLVGAGQALAGGEPLGPQTQSVVVVPGDTLWGIAAAHAAPGEDVRDVIVEIRELNDLSTSSVTVGQTLVVPGE